MAQINISGAPVVTTMQVIPVAAATACSSI